MNEKMYTETEAFGLAVKAAQIAIAQRPNPTHVTVAQAAQILGVSARTAARMNLPRNSLGKIPYEEVIAARSAR
jgi:hypothetical protein